LLLDVQNVTVSAERFGEPEELLHDVSFSVNEGEVIAIVGESGSGKTTLLKALTHLFPYQTDIFVRGRVCFNGTNILALDDAALKGVRRSSIRYVFQEPGSVLNPALRIQAQIHLFDSVDPSKDHETERDSAGRDSRASYFAEMGIEDLTHVLRSFPHELSVGMLQRLSIAIAISARPKLLLCDEPTSAVDLIARHQILDLLCTFCRSHRMALIMTTHDLGVARTYADRIIVLYAGRIVEEATNAKFFENPLHPYSKVLLGSMSTSDCLLEDNHVPREIPVWTTEEIHGCKFHMRCAIATRECASEEPKIMEIENGRRVRCPYWK